MKDVGFSLSAIMFAFNEGQHIEGCVRATLADMAERLDDHELVVVDDGSSDDTPEILASLAQEFPRLVVVTHPENRGIGEAVHTGYGAASKDYALIMPADGQVTLAEYSKLFDAVSAGADLVLASYVQRGEVDGAHRMILTGGLRVIIGLSLGVWRKLDAAFIFRRKLLEEMPLKTRSFFVNLELPIRAIRAGKRVEVVPMELFPRISGSSKVVRLGRIATVLRDVGKLRLALWSERLSRGRNA